MPLLARGSGKMLASISVFFISAFFHEYLVSVPLRMFNLWAFSGMMMQVKINTAILFAYLYYIYLYLYIYITNFSLHQIPLSAMSHFIEKKFGPRFGNCVVWISLILGQPLCIMMYYHDYVITHFGKDLLEKFGRM